MEVKVNDYIKVVKDLDCGLAELPKGMVFKVVKVNDRITTILNELIGGGGFCKAEINEFFDFLAASCISDLHHMNIGFINGAPVIIDYAGYDE